MGLEFANVVLIFFFIVVIVLEPIPRFIEEARSGGLRRGAKRRASFPSLSTNVRELCLRQLFLSCCEPPVFQVQTIPSNSEPTSGLGVGFGRRPCCCQIRPHDRHSLNILEGFNLAHVLFEADISRGVVDPYWRV